MHDTYQNKILNWKLKCLSAFIKNQLYFLTWKFKRWVTLLHHITIIFEKERNYHVCLMVYKFIYYLSVTLRISLLAKYIFTNHKMNSLSTLNIFWPCLSILKWSKDMAVSFKNRNPGNESETDSFTFQKDCQHF